MSPCTYLLVESSVSCPSHSAIRCRVDGGFGAQQSHRRGMAQRVRADVLRVQLEPHRYRAMAVCLTTRRPDRAACEVPAVAGLGNSGPAGSPPSSRSHTRRTFLAVRLKSGVHLFFLPLPRHLTPPAGVEVEVLAAQARRAPMLAFRSAPARSRSAWSRRPVKVQRSGAARSASISGVGEVVDERRLVAFPSGIEEHACDQLSAPSGAFKAALVEERMDRGQSSVAGAGAVAALGLQVAEERADHGGVEIARVAACAGASRSRS